MRLLLTRHWSAISYDARSSIIIRNRLCYNDDVIVSRCFIWNSFGVSNHKRKLKVLAGVKNGVVALVHDLNIRHIFDIILACLRVDYISIPNLKLSHFISECNRKLPVGGLLSQPWLIQVEFPNVTLFIYILCNKYTIQDYQNTLFQVWDLWTWDPGSHWPKVSYRNEWNLISLSHKSTLDTRRMIPRGIRDSMIVLHCAWSSQICG